MKMEMKNYNVIEKLLCLGKSCPTLNSTFTILPYLSLAHFPRHMASEEEKWLRPTDGEL